LHRLAIKRNQPLCALRTRRADKLVRLRRRRRRSRIGAAADTFQRSKKPVEIERLRQNFVIGLVLQTPERDALGRRQSRCVWTLDIPAREQTQDRSADRFRKASLDIRL